MQTITLILLFRERWNWHLSMRWNPLETLRCRPKKKKKIPAPKMLDAEEISLHFLKISVREIKSHGILNINYNIISISSQVMAIATLERCYDNYDVFKRVVKIRKGETVKMMMEATNVNSVKAIMSHFVQKVRYTADQLQILPDKWIFFQLYL